MQERRLNKIARLIQKELAEMFQRETQANAKGQLISVTAVRPTQDLSICKVYLSIFPTKDAQSTLEKIQHEKGRLRGELGRRLATQLRSIPDLMFLIDDSLDYIDHIDQLLKNK